MDGRSAGVEQFERFQLSSRECCGGVIYEARGVCAAEVNVVEGRVQCLGRQVQGSRRICFLCGGAVDSGDGVAVRAARGGDEDAEGAGDGDVDELSGVGVVHFFDWEGIDAIVDAEGRVESAVV